MNEPTIQIKLKVVIAAWRAVKNSNTLSAIIGDIPFPEGSQDRKDFVCVVTYLWPAFKYKKG